MKIKKGDAVQITVGKDKGKSGKVEKVFTKENKILVTGLNVYKRHLKKQGENKPGGIVEISRPLPLANLSLVCPNCHKPSRIGFFIDKSNTKYRLCKKCQKVIK